MSVSGLSATHRVKARKIGLDYMDKMLASPGQMTYSEGADRWTGIAKGRTLHRLFPFVGDCSATDTFLLWRAITDVHKGAKDHVNGQAWKGGFTGTMEQRGELVTKSFEVMDQVFYHATAEFPFDHVATYVGGGTVFSHGSMAGPFHLDMHYRPVHSVRRYI